MEETETQFYVRASNGDTATVRKISNEGVKKKLIDVDNGIMDIAMPRRLSIERRSSQGSDSIWADARKLSEAGIRRTSDSSIVLTEDTDGFIIGDRVWVGGTKPGHIAYIGETQFAPGDWAGIVLDEPIGKNDGSVAGFRYFQCENRKGVFSRLTRLSRIPLTTSEDGQVTPMIPSSSGTTNSSPTSTSRVTSPVSPTMPTSHAGIKGSEMKVGDRVIVMNSNAGSKAGMLRYIGTTQFAPGVWCGVELDEPLGKNDGSVQGVSYFECQDKFGLFAPQHKVSLSPSSRRPSSQCAMHPGGPGLRKFGSKESVNSTTSTISMKSAARVRLGVNSLNKKPPSHSPVLPATGPKRNPLQDVLKEKEIYIEQLLKERDMEKSESIVAASRVEAAERKFDVLNQEFIQFRDESDGRYVDMQNFAKLLQDKNKELQDRNKNLQDQVNTLQDHIKELSGALEDEKRRSEDLQFRFEEESINKSEVEQLKPQNRKVSNNSKDEKIAELEQILDAERLRVKELENESLKLFKAEETIVKMQVTQEENEEKLRHLYATSEVTDKLVEQLKEQMDSVNNQLEETLSINRKQEDEIMQLKSTIETLKVLDAQKQEEVAQSNKKCSEYVQRCKEGEVVIENLRKELEQSRTIISDLKKEIEESKKMVSNTSEEMKAHFTNEIELLGKKLVDSEVKNKNHENDLINKEKELNEVKLTLQNEKKNLEESRLVISNLKEELEESRKIALSDSEKIKTHFTNEIENLVKKLADSEIKIKNYENDLVNKEKELIETRKNLQTNIEDSLGKVTELEKQLESSKDLFSSKEKEIAELNETINKMENTIKLQNDEMAGLKESKVEIENSLRKEIESSQNKFKLKENEFISTENTLKSITTDLKKNIDKEKEKFTELETKYKELNAELQGKCNQIDILLESNKSEVNSLLKEEQRKFIEVKDELEKAKLEMVKQKNIMQGLRQQLGESDQNLNTQKVLVEQKEQEIMELKEKQEKFSELEKQLNCSKDLVSSKEKEILVLKEKIVNMENSVKSQSEKMSGLEKSSVEMETSFRKEIENLQNQFKLKESELLSHENSLTMTINDLKGTIEKEKINIAELEAKSKQLELDLKQKSIQLDNLLESNKTDLDKQLENEQKKFIEVSSELEKAKLESVEQHKVLQDLRQRLSENDQRFKAQKSLAGQQEQEISALRGNQEKITELEKQLSCLNDLISNKENEILNLNEKVVTIENTLQTEKQSALNKLTELDKQLSLSKDVCNNKEKEIADLNEKISKMENTIKVQNEEMINVEQSSFKNDSTYKKEIEGIQNEFKLKEAEFKSIENTLQTTVNDLKGNIEKDKIKITELEDKNKQLVNDLKEKSNHMDKFLENNKTEFDKVLKQEQKKFQEVNNELEKVQLEVAKQQNTLQDVQQRLSESEKRFTAQTLVVEQKEKEILALKTDRESYQQRITGLTSENADWKQKAKASEEKCSLFSQEKQKLEKDLQSLKSSKASNDGIQQQNGNEDGTDYQMQIEFQNSIIVDLQRKNEVLTARIEYLETGQIPAAPNGNGSERQYALRLYCDICEVFDAHETVDCQRQAMDSPPPQQAHKPMPRGYQRPYCENCEKFGHDTDDCDELTF